MAERIKTLFGAAPIGSFPVERQTEFLELLQRYGVKDLDTAFIYPGSEKALGEIGAPKDFIIHTKAPAFKPGSLGKASIESGSKESLDNLKTDSVETYFLHCPDPQTPIEETVDAIQQVYLAGKFKRFGLSNFKPEDVKRIHEYASSKGYVVPTVYQGNYNPVARLTEAELFPLLRQLNIRFYASSPLAGGFLVKAASDFTGSETSQGSHFDKDSMVGQLYHKLYNRPAMLRALSEWDAISEDSGVSKGALAYRWVTYHSLLKPKYGDGIILGASKVSQLEETLKALNEGPLDAKVAARIDKVWESVKDEAPLDNYYL